MLCEPLFDYLIAMKSGTVILEYACTIRDEKKFHSWKKLTIQFIQKLHLQSRGTFLPISLS